MPMAQRDEVMPADEAPRFGDAGYDDALRAMPAEWGKSPFSARLPVMPPSDGGAYLGAQAIRPSRGKDEPYVPDRGVIVPGQGAIGAARNQAAQAFVGGASSLVGGVGDIANRVTNIGARATTDVLARQLDLMRRIDGGETVAPTDDPIGYQDMSPEQRRAFRAENEAQMRQHIGAEVPENALQQAGKAVDEYAQARFPVDNGRVQDTLTKIGGAIGGLPPLMLATTFGGPVAGAALAGVQSYDHAYKQAKEGGASERDAHDAALFSGVTSAALMGPSAAILLRGLPIAVQNSVVGGVLNYAASSTTMIAQGQVQRLVDNALAQQFYDPERSLTQGMGDTSDMIAEGVAGLAGHAAPQAARAARAGLEALRTPDMAPELRQGAAGITQAAQEYRQAVQRPEPAAAPAEETVRPEPAAAAPPQADPTQATLTGLGYGADEIASMAPQVREAIAAEGAQRQGEAPAQSDDQAAPIPSGGFEQKAGTVVSRLMADLGVSREQASGIVGNLGHESGLQAINEIHPLIPGSRGGFGWGQWTGPRRRAFEQFAQDRGTAVTDQETNYQFLLHELNGSHKGILEKLRGAGSVEDAVRTFYEFESGGDPRAIAAMPDRLKFARQAMGAHASDAPERTGQRMFAGDMGIDTVPMLAELSDLVMSHDADGQMNPDYPHEEGLQPRDRSTVGSQSQVRDIAANLNPALLMPGPDASGGAPIVAPDGKVVENGNGRLAALSLAYSDPALAGQGTAYRQFLATQGFETGGMRQPVLVSRRTTPLAPDVRQQFIKATADRSTLAMNAAERARADADTAGRVIDLWQGQRAGAAGNAPFVRAFMQSVPAAERGALVTRDGELNASGEKRVQSAVVAHAFGDKLGTTLDRFATDDADGMKNIAGAMSDAAGTWAQMRSEAARGMIPAALDITPDLAHAVQIADHARQSGRPVGELLAQADFDRPISPITDALVRGFYGDAGLKRSAARDKVAERLRGYAERALKASPDPDMFGAPPPSAPELLKAASMREPGGAPRMLSARDERAAKAATSADADAATLTPEAQEARDRLRTGLQAMMRFVGLPPEVGLKLAERIVVGAHEIDGSYSPTRRLIEMALDTPAAEIPGKLFHESVHALMDPKLGLLTEGHRDLLRRAGDRWLKRGDNAARLEALYGKDPALLREEAVARMGEELFDRGMKGAGPVGMAYRRMLNAARGIGQALRGQGYRTAEDVFRSVLTGERAGIGSREALQGFAPAIRTPDNAEAAPEPAPASEWEKVGRVVKSDAPTVDAIKEWGAVPDRYLSKRGASGTDPETKSGGSFPVADPLAVGDPGSDPYRSNVEPARDGTMAPEGADRKFSTRPLAELTGSEIAPPATVGRRKAVERWAIQNLRGRTVTSRALGADVVVSRKGLSKALSHAGDDLLSAFPAIPALIESGERIGSPASTRDARDSETKAWHLLGGNVRIDGRDIPMVVHVRETRDGRFFYDLGMNREGGAGRSLERLKTGQATQEQPGSRISTPDDNMPSSDPDRKFAKRERNDGPMLWDKPGLERAGQSVIPGAERNEADALQRRADAPLAPKVAQKSAGDLPLFGDEWKQSHLFSLRDNLSKALRDSTEEPRRKLNAMLNQALFPMRAGTQQAQVVASKFANALRGIQYRYGQIDRQLVREFKPEDRAAMGRALDAQSVFEQRVRAGEFGGAPPPVPSDKVRFYHGWKGEAPDTGGSRWVTMDPVYARDFRAGDTPNNVSWVDVPKGHPAEVAAREWDDMDEKPA